jgi:hypothetical protein
MGERENIQQIRETFLKSRTGAIMRCSLIMVNSGRRDLAKQILSTTKIDRKKFEEIKTQNS